MLAVNDTVRLECCWHYPLNGKPQATALCDQLWVNAVACGLPFNEDIGMWTLLLGWALVTTAEIARRSLRRTPSGPAVSYP